MASQTTKRKNDSTAQNTSVLSKLSKPTDASKPEPKPSGLKTSLHGVSYQSKLVIVFSLAKAKLLRIPNNQFEFTITSEDDEAGKFDDVVYRFSDGNTDGVLKIQAKHKMNSHKISVSELLTDRDSDNPFALPKYFLSFYDQKKPEESSMEGLILCTNADAVDDVKKLLVAVPYDLTDRAKKSLDGVIAELFNGIDGNCYRLDYQRLTKRSSNLFQQARNCPNCAPLIQSPTTTIDDLYKTLHRCVICKPWLKIAKQFEDLYESFMECSDRVRLAKLLVKTILNDKKKQEQKISLTNPLFKEYRNAIASTLDTKNASNGEYSFTKQFIELPTPVQPTSLSLFRDEFEKQYRIECKNPTLNVWDELKTKKVKVTEGFLKQSDTSNYTFTVKEVNDKLIEMFCERFRLVINSKKDSDLDEKIETLWAALYDESIESSLDEHGSYEKEIASEKLFKKTFSWMVKPFSLMKSSDIEKALLAIDNTIDLLKLKGISNVCKAQLADYRYRICEESLMSSQLYNDIERSKIYTVPVYDVQFGASVVLNLLDSQKKDSYQVLLLDASQFLTKSNIIKRVLSTVEHSLYLVVSCTTQCECIDQIIEGWNKCIETGPDKKVLIVNRRDDSISTLPFCIGDLHKQSQASLLDEIVQVTLCDTMVSEGKIFLQHEKKRLIEEVFQEIDSGKQIHTNVDVSFARISKTYIYRDWTNDSNQSYPLDVAAFGTIWDVEYEIKAIEKNVSFQNLVQRFEKNLYYRNVFRRLNLNDPEEKHEPLTVDIGQKVTILLGEAGFGKTTSFTWLAWYFKEQEPSAWVVRCTLVEFSTDFKNCIQEPDADSSLRMLYQLIHLSLERPRLETLKSVRDKAISCSRCLSLADGKVILDEELLKESNLSAKEAIILRVFTEKFNAGEIIMLFDGFDEIAPHYERVVLKLLLWFSNFDGMKRLYFSSRSYGFREKFESTFEEPQIFYLQVLTRRDKAKILCKMLNLKLNHATIKDDEKLGLVKVSSVLLIYFLKKLRHIPLYLSMSVDVYVDLIKNHIKFSEKTIDRLLFDKMEDEFELSSMVKAFLSLKVCILSYEKIGASLEAADYPSQIEKIQESTEDALQLHELLALRLLFDDEDRRLIMSQEEEQKAHLLIERIEKGNEKTGLVEGVSDGKPIFLHHLLAEQLAASGLIRKCQEDRCNLLVYWKSKSSQIRMHLDSILASSRPLHRAVIQMENRKVSELMAKTEDEDTRNSTLTQTDDGGRTLLHLMVLYSIQHEVPSWVPETIDMEAINKKDNVFKWTALDYAFRDRKPNFIHFFLRKGASIDEDALYKQIVADDQDNGTENANTTSSQNGLARAVSLVAYYSALVIGFLSQNGVEYESHEAFQKIRKLNVRFMEYLLAKNGDLFYRKLITLYQLGTSDDFDFPKNEKISILQRFTASDSILMIDIILEHVKRRLKIRYNKTKARKLKKAISNEIFNWAIRKKSIHIIKYLTESKPSLLKEQLVPYCIAVSVRRNCKIEFVWFVRLYCNILKIEVLDAITNDSDEENDTLDIECHFHDFDAILSTIRTNLASETSSIILSLLVLTMIYGRKLMAHCLIKLFTITIDYSTICDLITLFSKIRDGDLNSNYYEKTAEAVFRYLVGMSNNLTSEEVQNLFYKLTLMKLYKLAQCWIELQAFDLQAIDPISGLSAFHQCVSQQVITWLDEVPDTNCFELFNKMMNMEPVNCFRLCDREGRSVVHVAMLNGYFDIVHLIIAKWLNIPSVGEHSLAKLTKYDFVNLRDCYYQIKTIADSLERRKSRIFERLLDQLSLRMRKLETPLFGLSDH